MVNSRLKVMTILGTRPEIIRLSRVMARLDEVCNHVIVHTGQNYDFELNDIFFEDLEIRRPDLFLEADPSSLGRTLGDILAKTASVLVDERPDAVLILGDTNSSLAGIMARRLQIPVYHMEAGNRCFDAAVPEEINRKIIDHTADFNLPYTEHARRNLLAEGLHPRRIYVTGSPMVEVLATSRSKIDQSRILQQLSLRPGDYFLASMHREENVDSESNLRSLLAALSSLGSHFDRRVIVSTHPRTRSRLQGLGNPTSAIEFLKPFSFSDYNHLQLHAACTLSDSGTISEESSILGFPAITVRNAMERPEAMDTGSIILTGLTPAAILEAVSITIDQWRRGERPPTPADYTIGNTSQRVVNLILGTARLHHRWAGIDRQMR